MQYRSKDVQLSGLDRGYLAMKNVERKRPRRTFDSSNAYIHFGESCLTSGPVAPGGVCPELPSLSPTHSSVRYVQPPACNVAIPTENIMTRLMNTCINKVRAPIHTAVFSPDGRRLITGSQAGELTLWDGSSWNFETFFQAHLYCLMRSRFMSSGQYMVTGDVNGTMKYWTPGMSPMEEIEAHPGEALKDISFSPGDKKFATCSTDSQVRVWDFYRRVAEYTMGGHSGHVNSVSWHPLYALLASGGKDTSVKLWDLGSGKEARTLSWHTSSVSCVAFSPTNPHWLLSGGLDNTVRLTDLRGGKEALATWSVEHKGITALSWHPFSERLFVTGSNDGAVSWWMEGKSYPAAQVLRAHDAAVWDFAWSPTSAMFVSVSNDYTTKFWTRSRPGDDAVQYAFQGNPLGRVQPGTATGPFSNHLLLPATGVTSTRANSNSAQAALASQQSQQQQQQQQQGRPGAPTASLVLVPPTMTCVLAPAGPRLLAPTPVIQFHLGVGDGEEDAEEGGEGRTNAATVGSTNAGGGAGTFSRPVKPPPPGYLCKKCGIPGHYLDHCPKTALEQQVLEYQQAGVEVPKEILDLLRESKPAAAGARPPPGPGYICRKCNVPGHWVEQCTAPSNLGGFRAGGGTDGMPGKPGPNYICHICRVPGDHFIHDCPQKPKGGAYMGQKKF